MNILYKVDAKAEVAKHRQLLVEISCRKYYTTLSVFQKSLKDSGHFAELVGIIAYLLRKRTRASDDEAAKIIGIALPLMLLLRSKIEYALREEATTKIKPMTETIAAIEERAEEVFGKKDVPAADTAPLVVSELPLDDRIVDAVVDASKSSMVSRKSLRSNAKSAELLCARDVLAVLLARLTGMSNREISGFIGQSPDEVEGILLRMRNPTDSRKHLIHGACQKLGIDPKPLYHWTGRRSSPGKR